MLPLRLASATNQGGKLSTADEIAAELARLADEKYSRTIEIPDGLTEDQAVAYMIEAYRRETGATLSDAQVRLELREKMAGRDRT